MLQCGFLPRTLGTLFILGGASFIADNLMVVAAPQYDLSYILVPMFVAMISWTLWQWIKGIDSTRWDALEASAMVRSR